MSMPSLGVVRICTGFILFFVSLGTLSAQSSNPQPSGKDDPTRQHAFELYESGKFVEAMLLLEDYSASHPADVVVKERLAFATMAYAASLSDPELQKKARVRARSIAVEAKNLGDNSGLLSIVLDLPEDGSSPAFSDRKEVNDAMKAAEADFVRGDMDKARDGYLQVLILDPKNYEAALFMGDVYFKQHINGSAGEWFAKAIEIDPNRETAYRYWGDALFGMGKSAEAREKYIQAVIAEPYNNKRSWMGLTQWAQRTSVNLNWVRLQDKSQIERKDEGHTNITLDASSFGKKDDPANSAWLMYGMNRALWQGDKFKKEFPNESKYRRTLREEADCLHLMVTVLKEQKGFEKKKKNLDPTLVQLVALDQAGLLEPFALLNRADGEIAQDYEPYRAAHRDTLYRYFDEFVVPKAPAGSK
jgi:tetratricopeptide (TPR) repeat protein